jgi:gamma-glutamylcyclotransferase (GGCT)/AIG2-like uncharacterized protein YtfP
VFFYGTLMTGFERRTRLGMDDRLRARGRGTIQGKLFDLGLYPAAVPSADGRVHGEVFEVDDPAPVLSALDDIEGYEPDSPDTSLYVRRAVTATLDDGTELDAWAYFYNAPLGQAPAISSGDYLAHLKQR